MSIRSELQQWRLEIAAALTADVDGPSPAGHPEMVNYQYQPGSLRIVRYEEHPELDLASLCITYEIVITTLDLQHGYQVVRKPASLELPVDAHRQLNLTAVRFLEGLDPVLPGIPEVVI